MESKKSFVKTAIWFVLITSLCKGWGQSRVLRVAYWNQSSRVICILIILIVFLLEKKKTEDVETLPWPHGESREQGITLTIPIPRPLLHYSGRPRSTTQGRLPQSSQTRSLGEVHWSFLCFNLHEEMMGVDLVNCACNYFLNYNCRVISSDRVHNIGRYFPSHIKE